MTTSYAVGLPEQAVRAIWEHEAAQAGQTLQDALLALPGVSRVNYGNPFGGMIFIEIHSTLTSMDHIDSHLAVIRDRRAQAGN